jgi:2-polyprenyl-3-methyl-5-hydroxy-6-metoxy-1,4-benzoquinol methylase
VITRLSARQRSALKRLAERIGILNTLYSARQRWRDRRATRFEDGDDLPPPRLRSLVGGTPDRSWFVAAGSQSAEALRSAAREAGFDLDDPTVAVLDFGCGCGRTSRHWGRPIHGTDVQSELVEWCQQHLPGSYRVNDPEPPTAYPDSLFDVVYAVSVFTHLTEDRQVRWLGEFARLIRPGGLLMLTTHGDRLAAEALSGRELQDYGEGRIVVCYPRQEGANLCASYHPSGSLARLSDEFDAVERREEALHGHDIHLLVRRATNHLQQ